LYDSKPRAARSFELPAIPCRALAAGSSALQVTKYAGILEKQNPVRRRQALQVRQPAIPRAATAAAHFHSVVSRLAERPHQHWGVIFLRFA
jgi:hypothetical protein